jgi:hypothetical protein
MNSLRNTFYLSLILLILLAACAPVGNAPANLKPASPVVLVTVMPLGLASGNTPTAKPLICNPPSVSITSVFTFCANPSAGLGGGTYIFPGISGDSTSYWSANSNNVSCNFQSTAGGTK